MFCLILVVMRGRYATMQRRIEGCIHEPAGPHTRGINWEGDPHPRPRSNALHSCYGTLKTSSPCSNLFLRCPWVPIDIAPTSGLGSGILVSAGHERSAFQVSRLEPISGLSKCSAHQPGQARVRPEWSVLQLGLHSEGKAGHLAGLCRAGP